MKIRLPFQVTAWGHLVKSLHQAKDSTWEPFHRLTAVPLVLSGPLCPAGISPPRGESPLSGKAWLVQALLCCIIGSPLGELAPQVTEGLSRKIFTSSKRLHERIPPTSFAGSPPFLRAAISDSAAGGGSALIKLTTWYRQTKTDIGLFLTESKL